MKRYLYSSESRSAPGSLGRRWIIPVLLVTALGSAIAVATTSTPQDQERAQKAVHGAQAVAAMPASSETLREKTDAVVYDEAETTLPRFDHCAEIRETCVVDGDTFWFEGVKVRIADIDTPEISQPQCAHEKALGNQATDRLIELLNAGPFELQTIGERDVDRYGRLLRIVVRDGRSLGDQLVAEGLARTWTGRREPWC